MSNNTCSWRLGEAPNFVRCGATVRFKMVRDDDERLVRKYFHFCDEHIKLYHEVCKDDDFYDEDMGK